MYINKYLAIISCLFISTTGLTQQSTSDTPTNNVQMQSAESTGSVAESSYEALFEHAIEGPKSIELGNQATFNLPADMIFLPKPQANTFMEMSGNDALDDRYGLIFPVSDEDYWWVDLTFEPSGYIKDDDAKDWDIDGMLKGLHEGLKELNAKRRDMQLPELATTGWIEKPTYDATQHRLIWSIDVHHKHPQPDDTASVNYNMYALGRDGFINLTLITDQDKINQERQIAQNLLADIQYKEGKRYSDFNPATDKVAEYGLAALIGGGLIAKKLGLFALIGAFILKFAKIFIIAGVAGIAFIGKLFGRKK